MISAHHEQPEAGQAAAQDDVGAAHSEAEPVTSLEWDTLPTAVRDRIVQLAAYALGRLETADIPRQLRPVARFAPAKRSKAGAGPLLAALSESSRFRTAVIEWLREHRVDALNPNGDDPVAVAATAVLLGDTDAEERVRLVVRNAEDNALRAERDAAVAKAQRLETELAQVRGELTDAQQTARQAGSERAAEVDKLKGRLREQGTRLREARDATEQARHEASRNVDTCEDELSELRNALEWERARAATERARADRAEADVAKARESTREAREADEVRLALLLDTLDGAADGVRRELGVRDSGKRPADTVPGARPTASSGKGVRDAAGLDQLLRLRNAHLVVDGYNVTKTGYPELALSDQRERLIQQLGALSARTGAETTVVFDGAGVVSVPTTTPRRVRVLFSDPGVLADDVIRSLTGAEPPGRPLVVATSDKEVVTSVQQRGAYSVASAVLLTILGRV